MNAHSVTTPRILGLVAACALLAWPALAQPAAPASGEFGDQVAVTEVLLDVLVTDRAGNVILGLTPDDFIVEEAGQPVAVTDLSFYSNRQALEELGGLGDIDPERRNRYFILFFERQNRAAADAPGARLLERQMTAARDSRTWVERELLLDDWVAVVSYDYKLALHQDFTRDKGAILAAIEDAVTGKDPGANWPSRQAAGDDGVPSLAAGLPAGLALRDDSTRIYDALDLLARASGGITGRKNLVMFSLGFGERTQFGQYKPDPRYFAPTVQSLNSNNVAVYGVDIVPPGLDYTLADGLAQLARETGGRYEFNITNFRTPLTRVARENSGYYLLSYQATHPAGSSGFQPVTVRLRNPGFEVRAREGYSFGP